MRFKKNCLVILQARTSSSRLPGKSLLPISTIPLAILTAKRAMNTGLEVVVATSWATSDDELVLTAEKYGLNVFRGPLENVLLRFYQLLKQYPDDLNVVRITADNPFPDGSLIERLVEDFEISNADYLSFDLDKMPYGLSAEIFKNSSLKKAFLEAKESHQTEHVTPWIRENLRTKQVAYSEYCIAERLRCTVDTFTDYIQVRSVFSMVNDPVYVSSRDLVRALSNVKDNSENLHKFVLGTAQLGQKYGIASSAFDLDKSDYISMLTLAEEQGVTQIDSANAYGDSENIISEYLQLKTNSRLCIYSKLYPKDMRQDKSVDSYLHETLFKSERLIGKNLKCMMFHRMSDALHGDILKALAKAKERGEIESIGISLQKPEEIFEVLRLSEISHIQIPLNLLDWRWLTEDVMRVILQLKERGCTIHVRSVYLQGLLGITDPKKWPNLPVQYDAAQIIKRLNGMAEEFFQGSIRRMAMAYVKSFDWIDGIVIGSDDCFQLAENIDLFRKYEAFNDELKARIGALQTHVPLQLLDPSLWNKND